MVLRFFLFAMAFLFVSCTEFKRDNPEDEQSDNYTQSRLSSSSLFEPRSSSGSEGEISSGSDAISSSSGDFSVSSSSSSSSTQSNASSSSSSSSLSKSSSSGLLSSSSSSSSSRSSSSLLSSSSSNALTYSLSCNITKKDFIAGNAISINDRPQLTCKETTTGYSAIVSESNATIKWNNAPNWENPAAGTYPSISATITSIGSSLVRTECNGLSASCAGSTIIVTAAASSSSSTPSSSSSVPSSSSYVPKGDNIANYKTKLIGAQTWMAENLDYNVSGSKCNNNELANCAKYGRLYDWATAMALPDCNTNSCAGKVNKPHQGICPKYWHIPSNDEWTTLTNHVGGTSGAGTKLKADNPDGYGFAALLGGYGGSDNNFGGVGIEGFWWSASEYGDQGAYDRYINTGTDVRADVTSKSNLFSVRCIRD